jgi:hypothetical protein
MGKLAGVLFNMRRSSAAVLVTLLVASAVLVATQLFPTAATSIHLIFPRIAPPTDWANDCARIKREVESGTSESARNNPSRLEPDAIAIYRALISSRNAGSAARLNVSDTTYAFDVASSSSHLSNCECLVGFEVAGLLSAARSFHHLSRDDLGLHSIVLVDEQTQLGIVAANDPHVGMRSGKSVDTAVKDAVSAGILSISEIAFNAQHTRALVSYRFYCGSLCGSGGIVLFNKAGKDWKRSEQICGGYVS